MAIINEASEKSAKGIYGVFVVFVFINFMAPYDDAISFQGFKFEGVNSVSINICLSAICLYLTLIAHIHRAVQSNKVAMEDIQEKLKETAAESYSGTDLEGLLKSGEKIDRTLSFYKILNTIIHVHLPLIVTALVCAVTCILALCPEILTPGP